MNLKKHVLGILLAIAVPICATAQNVTVKGQVKDDAGEPLALVSIAEPGTSNGTVTDLDGNYSISIASNGTLQFSFMGYSTVTEKVNGRTTINVTLSEDAELLDEIVVIGYGVQKKSDLTGAVASVRADDLKNRATSDAAAALMGKVSGIQILTGSGAPGTASEIRVRGYSSNATSGLGPLLIVDGLKVDNIQYLDPEMIESMEVLKDAASAAIYGAEAGNGVVLITTKSGAGAKGVGRVFYNGQFSLASLSRKLDIMNAQQYMDFGVANGYQTREGFNNAWDGVTDTDWGSEVFVPTWSQKHTVGFQGGNENGNLFVSINNIDNDGIFKGDKDVYKRLSMQINADYKIKKWLTIGTNNSIEKWSTRSISQQNDNGSAMLAAITSSPLSPVSCTYDALPTDVKGKASNHKILQDPDNPGMYWSLPTETQSSNPFVQRDATDSNSGGINVRGVAYMNLTPFRGFTYTSRFGYRISQNTQHIYTEPYYANSFVNSDVYTISTRANTGYYYQWENFINYEKTIGKSTISAMGGMSYIEDNNDNLFAQATGENILKSYEPNFQYMSYLLSSNDITKTITNAPGRSASLSYYGRIMFNYDNRYSLQANFRADAFDSSKLPKESRWGYFPSVSAGWTISNESFFKENIDRNVVSFLKLRGSYGVNGNINVLRDYPYSTSINYNSLWYQYTVGDPTLTYGSIPAGLANPDLKWETSTQLDLGLDARFLDNRLSLGVDFYNKITDDLLIQVSPVMEVGSTANQTINAGSIMNRGLEIELGWRDQIGDFGYSVSGNMGFLKNEVTYLDPAVDRVPGRIPQGTKMSTICEQGYPLWYILGYKTDGFKSDGSINYVDTNGDGGFDDNDRVCLGSAIPSFTYGFTINMNWKNFDFTVFGTGVSGNKISQQSFRSDRPFCNTYSYYWENSWKEGNEANAKFPAAKFWTQEAFSSDLNVFSGAYFKIKQIQLGYTVPKKYTAKAQMSQVRLFASLENYFTFTNYFGLDPETATTGGNAAAFDMGTYPTSKQFIMGINVSF